jgi:purine-binding chemotaxis protein CheW
MATSGEARGAERLLICRVGTKVCGLPLLRVIETMRPLPVEPLGQMPLFVNGLALIRGRATPVLDARTLLGSPSAAAPGRYVTLDLGREHGERVAALAVDAVVGVRRVEADTLGDLPGLLRRQNGEIVSALGALDSELLLVLEHSRLLPDAVWEQLEQQAEAG